MVLKWLKASSSLPFSRNRVPGEWMALRHSAVSPLPHFLPARAAVIHRRLGSHFDFVTLNFELVGPWPAATAQPQHANKRNPTLHGIVINWPYKFSARRRWEERLSRFRAFKLSWTGSSAPCTRQSDDYEFEGCNCLHEKIQPKLIPHVQFL